MIIFTLLGLIFLVLGLGMAIATFLPGLFGLPTEEGALLGLGITALTFVPIGVVFSAIGLVSAANARRHARLGRIGLPGRATIEAVADTGVTVNENPMVKLDLQVTVSGRSPYRVSKRATVPRLAIGLVAPGASVPVRVDPEDPEEIRIEWSGTSPAGGPVQVGAPSADAMPARAGGPGLVPDGILDPQVRDRVNAVLAGLQPAAARSGQTLEPGSRVTVNPPVTIDLRGLGQAPTTAEALEGRATVQAYTDTGVEADEARLYTFDLEIRLASRAPYTVKHAAVLDRDAAARLFRGASFPVRVDPGDEKRIAVEWGS